MSDKKEIEIPIPLNGALGILALGHKGLDMWRNAKTVENLRLKEEAKKKNK